MISTIVDIVIIVVIVVIVIITTIVITFIALISDNGSYLPIVTPGSTINPKIEGSDKFPRTNGHINEHDRTAVQQRYPHVASFHVQHMEPSTRTITHTFGLSIITVTITYRYYHRSYPESWR